LEVVDNLTKTVVFYRAAAAMKNHKTGSISWLHWCLSNKLGRQVIIEIAGFHKQKLFICSGSAG